MPPWKPHLQPKRVGLHGAAFRTHLLSGPKYPCRVCGFVTATEANRTRHERVYHRIRSVRKS